MNYDLLNMILNLKSIWLSISLICSFLSSNIYTTELSMTGMNILTLSDGLSVNPNIPILVSTNRYGFHCEYIQLELNRNRWPI